MKLYDDHVLPAILDFLCSVDDIAKQREAVVPLASGRVLEVGMGTGLNLPYYDAGSVDTVIGLDPSTSSLGKAKRRAQAVAFPVDYLGLSGETIPLPDGSVDTVLSTFTLCSIPDAAAALREMRRVLKPNGRLVFCEHGRAPNERLYRVQRRITPVWKRMLGGCHLDRDIPELLDEAGFRIDEMTADYAIQSWLFKVTSYQYWGLASAVRHSPSTH